MLMNAAERQLAFDVKRAIVLGTYIDHWGFPTSRAVVRAEDQVLELYSFPAEEKSGGVDRIATVGVSDAFDQGAGKSGIELVLPWHAHPERTVGEDLIPVVEDAATRIYRERTLDQGFFLPAPRRPRWLAASMLLIDEPVDEPASLATIPFAAAHVHVLRVVPIYSPEARLIDAQGLDAFDDLLKQSGCNVLDLERRSLV